MSGPPRISRPDEVGGWIEELMHRPAMTLSVWEEEFIEKMFYAYRGGKGALTEKQIAKVKEIYDKRTGAPSTSRRYE